MVYVVVALAFAAVWLFALVDAIRVRELAWAQSGRNKTVWVVLLAVSVAATFVYLALVRRSVHAAERHIQKQADAAERRVQRVRGGGAARP